MQRCGNQKLVPRKQVAVNVHQLETPKISALNKWYTMFSRWPFFFLTFDVTIFIWLINQPPHVPCSSKNIEFQVCLHLVSFPYWTSRVQYEKSLPIRWTLLMVEDTSDSVGNKRLQPDLPIASSSVDSSILSAWQLTVFCNYCSELHALGRSGGLLWKPWGSSERPPLQDGGEVHGRNRQQKTNTGWALVKRVKDRSITKSGSAR